MKLIEEVLSRCLNLHFQYSYKTCKLNQSVGVHQITFFARLQIVPNY